MTGGKEPDMKKIITILFLAYSTAGTLTAQLVPPDFLCVRGDTLFWNNPTVNCGPFVAWEVWGSQDTDGPFQLLASLSDPAQSSYHHPNPAGTQWFFYLVSRFDCPGQTSPPSDTLDNRPPALSPILSASVVDGAVLITWQPSPSPEVTGYIVYRETPIGVVPIDTVYSGNTYLDNGANPDQSPASYFVNALDPCGNTSIFDLKHTTTLLDGTLNPCRQSISLEWNRYDSWPAGMEQQEIWASINGGAPAPALPVDANAASVEFPDLNDGDYYCLFVQATAAQTGATARSNQFCFEADIVQSVRNFYLRSVSVNELNQPVLTWVWNNNAEIQGIIVLRSDENDNYTPADLLTPPNPLPQLLQYTDETGNPQSASVFYQVETTDQCGDLATSTYGATIHLTAENNAPDRNLIQWTPLDLENATVTEYQLYKTVAGTTNFVAATDPGTPGFVEYVDPADINAARGCYHVVATAVLTTPDGQQEPVECRSNTFCAIQTTRVFLPNAFAPEGFNQVFKPLIALGDVVEYEMSVYDRYGQRLFASDNPESGWDGMFKGRRVPQGVYTYLIVVTQSDGRIINKQGTVLLLRDR
ncbi:MAG: hypothetical protein RLY31_2140 [Bacteroidota bacterium]